MKKLILVAALAFLVPTLGMSAELNTMAHKANAACCQCGSDCDCADCDCGC